VKPATLVTLAQPAQPEKREQLVIVETQVTLVQPVELVKQAQPVQLVQ
jgi:hypothetical protein